MDEADSKEKKLQTQIDENAFKDADLKVDGELESRAADALRLEQFGDYSRSRERWEKIFSDTKEEPAQRLWFLLAGKKMSSLDAKTPSSEERKELLRKKLAEADKMFKFSTSDEGTRDERRLSARKGRGICREIRDIYAESEPVKEQVQRAKQLLEKYPKES
jgi:hypothetical protein